MDLFRVMQADLPVLAVSFWSNPSPFVFHKTVTPSVASMHLLCTYHPHSALTPPWKSISSDICSGAEMCVLYMCVSG